MIGFKFGEYHINDFDIGCKSDNRTLLPSKRKKEYFVLGKSGTVEYEHEEYDKRLISVELYLMRIDKFEDLRTKVRDVADWLSGSGHLVFDDEPDKRYIATVYDAIGLEQLALLPKATATVVFECQPFAESVELNNKKTRANKIDIENKGTVSTCGTIKIKNTGARTINRLILKRSGIDYASK